MAYIYRHTRHSTTTAHKGEQRRERKRGRTTTTVIEPKEASKQHKQQNFCPSFCPLFCPFKFVPPAEPTRKTQERQEVIERAIPQKMHPRPTYKFQARVPHLQPQVLLLRGRGRFCVPPTRKEHPLQSGSATQRPFIPSLTPLASASSLA